MILRNSFSTLLCPSSKLGFHVAKPSPPTGGSLITFMLILPVEAHSFLSFSPCIELCLSGRPGGRRSQRLLHLSPLLVNPPKQPNLSVPTMTLAHVSLSLYLPTTSASLPPCYAVFFPSVGAHCLSNNRHGSHAPSVPEKAQIGSVSAYSTVYTLFRREFFFRKEVRHFTGSQL